MKGGSLGVKASCDEKSKHWLLARRWYLREGAGGAGTAETWQMAFCRLHLVCQEAGKRGALGCAALLPHCPHHPLKIGDVVSLFVWFRGIRCWNCDPSIASQREITLKVKSAENSQVTCNLIPFGKGEQSPEVSRLEGGVVGWDVYHFYGQAQISEGFFFTSYCSICCWCLMIILL